MATRSPPVPLVPPEPDTAERHAPGDSEAFWSAPLDQLLADLRTTADGLTTAEAERRLTEVGPNVAAPKRRAGPWRLVLTQLRSPITALLLIAAVLSISLGETVDGGIILGILVASGALGFWQEYAATNAVEELLSLVRTTCSVVRDGRPAEVPIEEIVPGDVVQLAAGASAPGDGRLLESKDLYVDQAMLTGESVPAEKSTAPVAADATLPARTNAVWLGTHVVSGTARAVVVRTGRDTEFGAIAQRLALRPPETEFERGVRRFGFFLLEIATALVIVIFAVNVALHRPVLDALLFTLALAVGLTPQLLPAIVSVTLSYGARRMAAEGVVVRRLASIEDLGGMEILCTDKTGTITEGTVAVHAATDWTGAPSERVRLLAYLNAKFETGFPNPMDDALRSTPVPGAEQWVKVDEVPYDFARKRLSVAVECDGRRMLVTKGALASVLEVCESVEGAEGGGGGLAAAGRGNLPAAAGRGNLIAARATIQSRFATASREGRRCIGVAWRPLPDDSPVGRADERGLVFAGMLEFADPLKAGVADTIHELESLGIQVKLVSGDNREVAARLATEAGIDASIVRTGSELSHLSEAALVSAAPRIGVFAEVEPHQKERIIRALKKSGRTVGYLGDGINDAAALHAADVGISVDSATDVTKQAADIVLLVKDLGVLSRGVREGRRAFANTLKYVFITTSASFGNMFSMAGASLLAPFLPLLPKQILLINVLSDLPAMAIAADRLDPELVERPRRWDNRAIGRFMLAFGLVSSVFDYLTFGTLLWLAASPTEFRTAWFTESVLSEILILLVIRTRRWLVRSRLGAALGWSSAVVAVVTLALPYLPFAAALGFAPMPARLVWLLLGIVGLYVLVSELSKRAVFRRAVGL